MDGRALVAYITVMQNALKATEIDDVNVADVLQQQVVDALKVYKRNASSDSIYEYLMECFPKVTREELKQAIVQINAAAMR